MNGLNQNIHIIRYIRNYKNSDRVSEPYHAIFPVLTDEPLANPNQTFWYVVFPIIAPSIVGIALFGFTLSYDELARSSQVMGATNTLPLDLRGLTTTVTTPIIYALGTVTTSISFLVIGISLSFVYLLRHRKIK